MPTTSDFVVYVIKADPSRLWPRPVTSRPHDEVLGLIAYLNIEPANRAVEVGAVLYGPRLQRTAAATEVTYLMLRHVFGAGPQKLSPPYRRVVWKCNKLNKGSSRAAERLGFVYEGTSRKHMILKGRSRDSNWFSIVDDEWPALQLALETWLRKDNFEEDGWQKRKLEDLRAEGGTN
jgi:RimJ/RimL family protein N-acetyltransferase